MVGMGLFFGAKWYIRLYGQQGFAAILYTVTTGAFKAEAGIIRSFIVGAICPAILSACVFAVLIFFDPRRFSWSAKWEGKKIFLMFPRDRDLAYFWRQRYFLYPFWERQCGGAERIFADSL